MMNNIPAMKKAEAIELMKKGTKITHRHFSADEWMKMSGAMIILEDGVKCHPDEFWRHRDNPMWEDGYDIWRDELQLKQEFMAPPVPAIVTGNTIESCEVSIKVNLKTLKVQKEMLLALHENMTYNADLHGIITMIDSIQDKAVEENGFDENDIFTFTKE